MMGNVDLGLFIPFYPNYYSILSILSLGKGRFLWLELLGDADLQIPTTKGKCQLNPDYLMGRLQLNCSELGFYSGWREMRRDLVFIGQ